MTKENDVTVVFKIRGDEYSRVFYDSMMVCRDIAKEPLFEISYSGRSVNVPLRRLVDAVLDRLTLSAIKNEHGDHRSLGDSGTNIDTDEDDDLRFTLDELPERFYHCKCDGKRVSMRDYQEWLESGNAGVKRSDGTRPEFYPKSWVNGICTECHSVLEIEGSQHDLVSSSYGDGKWNSKQKR